MTQGAGVGWLALMVSVSALVCALLPGAAMFIAMGLAIASVGLGLVGYRRRTSPGTARLAGAGGMALGLVALVLGAARYGVILAIVRRLESML